MSIGSLESDVATVSVCALEGHRDEKISLLSFMYPIESGFLTFYIIAFNPNEMSEVILTYAYFSCTTEAIQKCSAEIAGGSTSTVVTYVGLDISKILTIEQTTLDSAALLLRYLARRCNCCTCLSKKRIDVHHCRLEILAWRHSLQLYRSTRTKFVLYL